MRVASLSGVVTVGAIASTATSRVDTSDAVRTDLGLAIRSILALFAVIVAGRDQSTVTGNPRLRCDII